MQESLTTAKGTSSAEMKHLSPHWRQS